MRRWIALCLCLRLCCVGRVDGRLFSPQDAPGPPRRLLATSENASALRLQLLPPAQAKAEGVNGAPVLGYRVELARRVDEVQTLTVSSSGPVLAGSYRLTFANAFGSDATACLPWNASAAQLELALEELVNVDAVRVTRSALGAVKNGYTYAVTFDGDYLVRGPQPNVLVGDQVGCLATQPANRVLTFEGARITAGVASYYPEVWRVSTQDESGTNVLSGSFDLSIGFDGDWVDTGITATISPGSKTANTLQPMVGKINRGDRVKIGDEEFTVHASAPFTTTQLPLDSYHVHGATNTAIYVRDTALGDVAVKSQDASVTTYSDFTASVAADEFVKIGEWEFKVNAISASSIQLDRVWPGTTARHITAHKRKKVTVSAAVEAVEMEDALASLPGIGSVSVTRTGPTRENGFTWLVTFLSLGVRSYCPRSPCLYADKVTGNQDRLRDHYGQSCPDCTVTSKILQDETLTTILRGVTGDFTSDSVVAAVETNGGVFEVQAIAVTADANDLDGSFAVNFENTFSEYPGVVIYVDDTPIDVQTKLQNLPGMGRANVTLAANDQFGVTWMVTFLSNIGDMPLLLVDGLALVGTNANVQVTEIVKGSEVDFELVIGDLNPGEDYYVRAFARNADGYGAGTDTVQPKGGGALPLVSTSSSFPSAPRIVSTLPVSGSEIQIGFVEPDTNGEAIERYIFEYATDSTFGIPAVQKVFAFNTLENDIVGTFRLQYAADTTAMLPIQTTAVNLQDALNQLPSLRPVTVSRLLCILTGETGNSVASFSASSNILTTSGSLTESQIQMLTPGAIIDANGDEFVVQTQPTLGSTTIRVQTGHGVTSYTNDYPLLKIDDSGSEMSPFGYQWTITFSEDPEHELSATSPSLRISSSLRSVEAGSALGSVGIIDGASSTPPSHYGHFHFSSSQDTCDTYRIGASSNVQIIQLFASTTITDGSFKLQLGDQVTSCISIGTTNIKSSMKSKLEALAFVHMATVEEERNFKVMVLNGASSSHISSFDAITSQVTITKSGGGGLTSDEVAALGAGAIFRASRNSNDFSRDSCEFSVATSPLIGDTTIDVVNIDDCLSFTDTRALQLLDLHDYKIRLWGRHPSGEWPTLQFVASAFGDGTECAAQWAPATPKPVYGVIHSVRYEGMCANGQKGTQTIVAEAQSAIGGTFKLSYGGQETSALAFQETTVSAMRDAIEAITAPGAVNVSLSRYGTYGFAWQITFISAVEDADTLFIKHSRLTGQGVVISVYDSVDIFVDSDQDDLRGSFRISFNGEVTEPIAVEATHKKVTQELQKLASVDSVAAMGDIDNSDIGVYTLQLKTAAQHNSAVLTNPTLANGQVINPTKLIALREQLEIDGAPFWVQSITPADITLTKPYTGTSGQIMVSAGLVTKKTKPLPGYISLSYRSRVIAAIAATNPTFEFAPNHGFQNGDSFFLNGIEYTIRQVIGTTITTVNPYTGATVSNASPTTYVYDNRIRTTSDWTNLVSTGDYLWIRGNGVDVTRYAITAVDARYVDVTGTFVGEIVRGIAYHASNGRQWSLIFRSYLGSLESLDIIPENDFRGTNALIGARGSNTVPPRTIRVGNPSVTQTVLLEAMSTADAVGAAYTLTFDGETTTALQWNAAALTVKNALESLDTIDGVTVETKVYGYGYVHSISFWGIYPSRKLPLLQVRISGAAVPAHVSARVDGNNAVATSRYENLILSDDYAFRMYAVNHKGLSSSSQVFTAQPWSVSVVPTPPTSVVLGEFHGSTWLSVNYRPPIYSGGAEVTMYRLEWDSTPSFDSSSPDYGVATIQKRYEVQYVTTSYRSATGAGGTFTLSWGGQTTSALPFDCSSNGMADALAIITGTVNIAIDPVKVRRVQASWGYTWRITFQHNAGDLSALVANGKQLTGDFPRVMVDEIVDGFSDLAIGDFTREVQDVYTDSKTELTGSFKLQLEGKVTASISVSSTALEFQQALQSITDLYSIKVTKAWRNLLMNNAIWSVTFAYLSGEDIVGAGNVFVMLVADSTLGGTAASVQVAGKISGTDPFRYSITGLRPGVQYYMHALAYNEEGFGSATSPMSTAITCGQPNPPDSVSAAVRDGTSLSVRWSASPDDGGCPVSKYKIEWYRDPGTYEEQTITTSAGKGLPEVQRLINFADTQSLTGNFKLSFRGETTQNIAWNALATGPNSVKEQLERLSSVGTLGVTREASTRVVPGLLVTVSTVLTPTSITTVELDSSSTVALSHSGLMEGMTIWIAGFEMTIDTIPQIISQPTTFTVVTAASITVSIPVPVFQKAFGYSWSITFLAGHVGPQPLIKVFPSDSWAGNNPGIYVESIQKGLQPISGMFKVAFASGGISDTSPPLSHNASALELKNALESLVTVGNVNVTRSANGYGYNWVVTFLTEFANELSLLVVDGTELHGPSVRISVARTKAGLPPVLFCENSGVAGVPIEIGVPGSLLYNITGLTTGVKYGIRVRAYNQEGYGGAKFIFPEYQIPRTVSGVPNNVKLVILSSRLIKVRWLEPDSDGGSAISSYLVQWDTSSSFQNAASPNYDLQRRLSVANGAVGPFFLNIPALTRTSYFVRVYAVNDQGRSSPAVPSPSSTIPFDQTPGKPEVAVASVLSSYAIQVTWEPSSVEKTYYGGDGGLAITQYMIEWDSSSKFDSPASFGLVQGSERSYIIGGDNPITGVRSDMLTPETTYYVRITAFNAKGAGTPIATVPASVLVTNQPPSAPQDLSLAVISSSSVLASWKNPQFDGGTSLKAYHLEWDEQEDFTSGQSSSTTIPIVREMQSVIVRSDVVNEEQFIEATVEVTNEEQMVRTIFTGVDEVQVIQTTNAQVVDEVVSVKTSAGDINELQELRLDADDINEIQAVRSTTPEVLEVQSIQVGASRINEIQTITFLLPGVASDPSVIRGTISLTFDSRLCTYCTLPKTYERSADLLTSLQDSNPVTGAAKVKTELDALSNIDSVTVSRTDTSSNGDLTYVYSITFSGDAVAGNVLELSIDSALTKTVNSVTSTFASIPTTATEFRRGNEVLYDANSVFSITYTCESYSGPAETTGVSAECTPPDSNILCQSCVTAFDASTSIFTINVDLTGRSLEGSKFQVGACSFEVASGGITATTITIAAGDVGILCSSFSQKALTLFKAKQFVASVPVKSSATQPLVDSSVQSLLNAVINSVTVTGTQLITTNFVGTVYAVTFRQRSGTLPLLICGSSSILISNSAGSKSCTVSRTRIGSTMTGTFLLGLTAETSPSTKVWTGPIPWDASETQMKAALELIALNTGELVFGTVNVKRSVYSETGNKWSGGFTWQIEFTSRRGNIPRMDKDFANLVDADPATTAVPNIPSLLIEDYTNPLNPSAGSRDGNQITGTMTFAFRGVTAPNVYDLSTQIDPATVNSDITDAAFASFLVTNLGIPSTTVTRSRATQAGGFTWTIEFKGQSTGGDVELLQIPITALVATNVRAQVVETRKGNQLGGTFQLTFNGDSTGPILFSADKTAVQAQLNSLSSIKPSSVLVDRVGPLDTGTVQVRSYQWLITFYSSVWADPTSDHSSGIAGNWKGARAGWTDVWPDTGYSKAWGRHVGPMDANGLSIICVKDGLTTTASDNSQGCTVTVVVPGVGPIKGSFKVSLDTRTLVPHMSVSRLVTSSDIAHNAWATRAESGASGTSVEEILESMANVGDVSVTRSAVNPQSGGYSWTVTFLRDAYGPCEEVEYSSTGARLCNSPGDVPTMTAIGTRLDGSSPVALVCGDSVGGTCFVGVVRNGQILRGDFTAFKVQDDLGIDGRYFLLPTCDPLVPATCSNIQTLAVDQVKSSSGIVQTLLPQDRFTLAGYPTCIFTATAVTTTAVTVISTTCPTMNPGVLVSLGLTILLPWNAAADAVTRVLQGSKAERKVSVQRTVQGKYGEMSWLVRFISNPGFTPLGAGNILDISSTFSPEASTTNAVAVSVTEMTSGSRGLSGSFLIDFHSTYGPRQVAFNEAPQRLMRKINEMNTIGRVTVDRFEYPSTATGCTNSACSGGWEGQPVSNSGTRGGYRWRIRFMKVTGEYGGLTFPTGSGNVGPLSVTLSSLQGSQRSIDVTTSKAGSTPITGMFSLNTSTKSTPPLQYSSSADTIKQGIESMRLYGDVDVTQDYYVTQQIPDAIAIVSKDGITADITGVDDISQYIAPGDVLRFGYVGESNLMGSNGDWPFTKSPTTSQVGVSALSPVVLTSFPITTEQLYPGMTLRIDGQVYSVKHSGQEIQQVTVSMPIAAWDPSVVANVFKLRLTSGTVTSTTTCLSLNALASEVQDQLNTIPEANIKVVRSGPVITESNSKKGYTYAVYFGGSGTAGDVGTLVFSTTGCTSLPNSVPVTGSVAVTQHGGAIGHQRLSFATESGQVIDTSGYFKLSLGGLTSRCLRWGVTDSDLQNEIETRLQTGDVIVARQGNGNSVTEVQRLRMTSSSEVTMGNTGLFQIMFTIEDDIFTTSCLSYGISADDLQTRLNGLATFGAAGNHINVTRSGDGTSSWGFGYEYLINFRGPISGGFSRVLGNMLPIEVINVGEYPCGAVVGGNPALIVETVRDGSPGYKYDIFFLEYPSAITPKMTLIDERNLPLPCGTDWTQQDGSVRKALVEQITPGGSSETQVLTIKYPSPGTTFKLMFAGQTTSSCLSVTALASDIQTALNALSTIRADGVVVDRQVQPVAAPDGYVYKITFVGDTVAGNVPTIQLDYTGCVPPVGSTEDISVFPDTEGGLRPGEFALSESYHGESPGSHVAYAVSQLFSVMQEQFEIQQVAVKNPSNNIDTATGTFKLTYKGSTSASIAWNADEDTLQTALLNLIVTGGATQNPGAIVVTRRIDAAIAPNGYLYTIYFSGTVVTGDLDLLVVDSYVDFHSGSVAIIPVRDGVDGALALQKQLIPLASSSSPTTAAAYMASDDTLSIFKVNGFFWTIKFTSTIGDVPRLSAQPDTLTSQLAVVDNFVQGSASDSFLLTNLLPGIKYYVHVAASTDIGVGPFSTPAVDVTPSSAPSAVQNVDSGYALFVPEVQEVRLAAKHVTEIQAIATTAASIPEVQTLRTFAAPDVCLDNDCIGGKIAFRVPTIQTITITSDAVLSAGEFQIGFVRYEESATTPGTFAVVGSNTQTTTLSYAATAIDVQMALLTLDTLEPGDIVVTRDGDGTADYDYGYIYSVTFVGNNVAGETERLEIFTIANCALTACAAFANGGVNYAITVEMNSGFAMGTDTAIQEVVISANKSLVAGSYKLSFYHLGATRTSSCIQFDAPARSENGADLRAMESALSAMSNIDKVYVSRTTDSDRAPNGYIYRIFFYGNGVYGDIDQMTAVMTGCTDFQTQENNVLTTNGVNARVDVNMVDAGGFNSHNTFADPTQDTADDLAIDLDRLPVFGNVLVSQSLVDEQGGYMWTVAYKDSEGNLPPFICAVDDDFAAMPGATCETETLTDGNTLSGSFVIEASVPILFDASAADMKLALEAMDWVGTVQVTRSGPSAQRGYAWTITFLDYVGDVPALMITSSLVGTGSSVSVTELRKGNSIEGSFTLAYLNSVTKPILWNAPATASDSGGDGRSVQEKLESLAVIGALNVERSPVDHEGGYSWQITFLDNTLNPGDLPLLRANATTLSGEGVVAFTREVIKGSNAVGDQLWLSFDPPESDNGSPITKYRVRWDTSSTFAASPAEYYITDPGILYQTQHIITQAPSLSWSSIMAPVVPEVQKLTLTSIATGTFTLAFRGQVTNTFTIGTSTANVLQSGLTALSTVGGVIVTPVGGGTGITQISPGTSFMITFTAVQGILPILVSNALPTVSVSRVQAGSTNFRKKVLVFTCTSAAIATDEITVTAGFLSDIITADTTLTAVEDLLIDLFNTESGGISVVASGGTQTTLCAAAPAEITVTLHHVYGDAAISFVAASGNAIVANIASKSIDGVYNAQPDARMSGTFQIGYGGVYTRSLNAESTADQIRYALEDLPTIDTVGVAREPSYQPVDGKVDVVNGQIYVSCSDRETCDFSSGAYGLPGDIIRIGGSWYTVRADDFSPALHSTRLYLGDMNGHETGYTGASQTGVRAYEWSKGYIWTVAMLRVPTLTYLRAKVPRLYPLDADVRITGSSCNKCYYLPTGTSKQLTMGQQYFLQVDAYNDRGKGVSVLPPATATPSQVPNAPSNVDLAVVSGTQLEVFFSPPALATTNVSPNFNNDISSYIVQWDVVSVFKHGLPVCSSCALSLSGSNVLTTSAESQISSRMTIGTRFTVADDSCVLEVAQAIVGLTVTVKANHGCTTFSSKAYSLYYYTFEPAVISGALLAVSPPYRYLITGLSTTTAYYVRVAAVNSVPVQQIALDGNPPNNRKWSYPLSATTKDKVPDPPISVMLVPFSGTSFQIQIQPPTRDGQGLNGAAITHYWIDIDTISTFDSADKQAPLEIAAGNIPLLLEGTTGSPIIYMATGLTNGMRYFVQVKAKNAIGYSRATLAPSPLAPTRSPDAPANVKVSTVSTSLLPIQRATVTWQRPVSNGGLPITSYKVEWWRGDASRQEVQVIEIKWTSQPTAALFTLSFSGSQTGSMPFDVAPENLRSALMNIMVMGHITVSRSTVNTQFGYHWSVTFASSTVNPGDQPMIRIHLDAASVTGGAGLTGSVSEVTPGVAVPTIADFPGSREIQVLVVSHGTLAVGGFVRFSFKGSAWSSYIPVTASADVMQQCLQELPTLGQVIVSSPQAASLTRVWMITFVSLVGNAPAITVDSSKVIPAAAFVGIKDGDNAVDDAGILCLPGGDAQWCPGRSWTGYSVGVASSAKIGERAVDYSFYETIDANTLTYTITGLTPGLTYFVTVTAKNALGLGPRMRSSPSSIAPPIQVPQPPTNVVVDVNFGVATQLKATWDAPTSDGGADVWMYRIEYDPSPLFKNRGQQDVWCPTSPTPAVWRIQTSRTSTATVNGVTSPVGDAIANGFFNLVLTRQNRVLTTESIPWNAVAISADEAGGTPASSDVFCTPCSSCVDSCASSTTYQFGRREMSGSMQSKLEYLSTITSGVKVSRSSTSDAGGGYTWTVTFNDVGDDFNLQPAVSNSLTCGTYVNNVAQCNGGVYSVTTTKITAGVSNSACSSVGQVIPAVGALNKGQLYYVRVFAYNKIGFSLPALAASPQKPMVVPGPPTGVTLQVASVSELVVLFSPPDDNGGDAITAYQVQWALDNAFSAGPGAQLVTLLSGGAPYTSVITGLVKGTHYYVRVRARNSQGFGSFQLSSPTALNPHTTPGAPTRVALGVTSATMLTVQWSVPDDDGGDALTGFVVQWDVSASFDSLSADATTARITDVAQRSYTITMLTPGTSYFVRVFAANRAGPGTPQTASPASLVPANTRPGKPHTLTAAATGTAGELSVSWQLPRVPAHGIPCGGTLLVPASCPVVGVVDAVFGGLAFESYLVQWSRSSDFAGYDWRAVVSASFLAAGLDSGARYYVRVLAVTPAGQSDFCAKANSGGYLCPDRLVLLDGSIVSGGLVSAVVL